MLRGPSDETAGPSLRELSLSDIRARQIRILQAVARHCDAQGITYYLCAGTLLGAVRHGGYIPWDDDIDIMLPRRHYERLCETFPRRPDPEGLSLHSLSSSRTYAVPFAKVCDDTTVLKVESDVVEGIGVYVDAFPLDGWCQRRLARMAQKASLRLLTKFMLAKHLQLNDKRDSAKNVLLRLAKIVAWPFSARSLAHGLTWIARRSDFERCDKGGVIVWGYRESVERSAYGEPATVMFEGSAYPAPADTDRVLSEIYGQYMQLPPEAERVTRHRFTGYALD